MGEDWTLPRTFASEQGEVRWDVLGDGPPVVLLHGAPFSSYRWTDIARALSGHFTVYVWDLDRCWCHLPRGRRRASGR
jgi:pimeloyl-ACP methyl ester carboxylesterase